MAIENEDNSVIEHGVSHGAARTNCGSFAFAITVLAAAEIIVIVIRNSVGPVLAEFGMSHSIVFTLAYGLWLPATLAFAMLATMAMPFVLRVSRIAHTWNSVACLIGVAAVAFVVLSGVLGLLECLS